MNKNFKPERILIFELNWLGDILFSFPLIRAIRKKFPEAYITCVVVPRYMDLLVNNPWINDVYAFSDERGLGAIKEKIVFTAMLRRESYDTCFFLKPSKTKAIMAAFAGIKTRIGFGEKKTAINCLVDLPKEEVHRADHILSLARSVGIKEADGSYEYFINEADVKKAKEVLRQSGGGIHRTVVINPGGNWDAKRWPVEKHKDLAKRIVSTFKDVEVIISGSKKDIDLADGIVSFVEDKRCYSIAGQTGLNELAAIFAECSVMISADSGPLHLASANNAPTVGLFGPTSCELTGPRGKKESVIIWKDCGCDIPCYAEHCEKAYACMDGITVDEVFDAAKKVLGENE